MSLEEEAWDGWGYRDTRFVVRPDQSVVLTGNRYPLSGVALPDLLPWFAEKLGAPLSYGNQHTADYPPSIPAPLENTPLLIALATILPASRITQEERVRLRHGHGHSGAEIWAIRYGRLPRVPDAVVFPESHEEVVQVVRTAHAHGACVIPVGGGTNVTEALRIGKEERRFVLAVSTRLMNKLLAVDVQSRTARIEAGANGRDIEQLLAPHGVLLGHEPDSLEFSTLGGWVATNASGMKKNRYGNIEDLVLDVTAVTASGEISRSAVGPRESIGVNPKNLLIGSEGNLGIVTSVVVKLSPLPEKRVYGSVLFPKLERGFHFLSELAKSGALPASVRLMDNTQFHFGQRLKARAQGPLARAKSAAEKLVVTRLKGFDPNALAVATVVFEGTAGEVAFQEATFYRLASRFGGMKGGASNGERGYQLTFGIAYIRDLTFSHWAIAESFETSVPWDKALTLYDRVAARVKAEHKRLGLPGAPFFTGRFTQVYATGVCIYFYLGFYAKDVDDPVARYAELEHAARDEILLAGGTLSHHHGVGKIRQSFLNRIYSEGALSAQRALKSALDPDNLFGAGNHAVNGLVEIDTETTRSPA